jgi:alkylation response protein AidB-like acyl-CoA dehydrogenase
VLNGNKTFITNGPYADTIVFICKLDDGNDPRRSQGRQLHPRAGMPGLVQSKPLARWACTPRRPASSSSKTCASPTSRLLGETEDSPAREGAKETFTNERTGVAAMALGIVEQCLELCTSTRRRGCSSAAPSASFSSSS